MAAKFAAATLPAHLTSVARYFFLINTRKSMKEVESPTQSAHMIEKTSMSSRFLLSPPFSVLAVVKKMIAATKLTTTFKKMVKLKYAPQTSVG